MGSKHGTFIQSTVSSASTPSSSAEGSDERGLRLSLPRVASIPRTLSHLDRLTIGGTVFVVHIHDDGRPCAECSPQAGEEIPLFSHQSTRGDFSTTKKRKVDAATTPDNYVPEAVRARDPKKALAMLKRSLLSSQESSSKSTSSIQTPRYVDRSARRRALHPDHTPITRSGTGSSKYLSPSATAPPTPPASALVSAPSMPLPSSNIGHRLLMRQGWTPGSALGDPENGGLVAPLEPPSTIGRTGLGVPARASTPTTAPQDGDWRDAGKKRRWTEAFVCPLPMSSLDTWR
ncbi:hypothetical protein BD413DRAFT_566474 [Trametes elegans]|nr:hypothetical protein BD413DRAFT_566474 [Trametes elegans]